MDGGAWWAVVYGVAKSRTRLSVFTFTFHFHALEKEMATHSNVLAWRISGMGKPGELPSMGSHRVGHDWSNLAAAAAASVDLLLSISVQFSSVQSLSHVRLFATPWITARQASCPLPTPGVHSDSRPLSQWCHPAISSSVIHFSSCPQSLPASESFPMSQLFAWGGQSTGVSASATFLPKKSQGWSPSEWTGWISLESYLFTVVDSAVVNVCLSIRSCYVYVHVVCMFMLCICSCCEYVLEDLFSVLLNVLLLC